MTLRLVLAAAIALLAAPAHADRVHLVSGAVIEGKATREGDRVVVEVESGQLGIPSGEVARIERATSPVQQVEARREALAARDIEGRIALADYCRDHGMRGREEQLLREVIELAPDHAQARERLGYVRNGDSWITREQQLRAQGLVQHEGRWLTPEQVLEIERLRAAADTAAQQRAKAEAELAAAKLELETRKRAAAADEASAAPAAPVAPPVAYPSLYGWSSPYAFDHRHDRRCPGPRCVHRSGAKRRSDGRPPWPIVGTKDPFDYLR